MPLHLLGKKSWNVYNTENTARVRRDEAAAKAREEEQEQKWRDDDAKRRISLLKGQDLQSPQSLSEPQPDDNAPYDRGEARKRRRLAGEDDTDRDLRLARHHLHDAHTESLENAKRIVNSSLTKIDSKSKSAGGNEADTQGMCFCDAAGYRDDGSGPWYAKPDNISSNPQSQVGQDVWGNEDPRRREREGLRIANNDPLLAIKRGVKKLRENEKEREAWKRQRENDLYEVEYLARLEKRAKKHRRDHEEDLDLAEFKLDQDGAAPLETRPKKRSRSHHDHHNTSHKKSRHRHRNRSRSPDPDRRHHRRRKNDHDNERASRSREL